MRRSRRSIAIALAPCVLLLVAAEEPAEAPEATAPVTEESEASRVLELEARQAALRALELDVHQKLDELKALREATLAAIAARDESSAADLARIVKFYQAMKPGAAADLLEQLPLVMAADVIAAMGPRQAGKILNVMEKKRAVAISRRMAGK